MKIAKLTLCGVLRLNCKLHAFITLFRQNISNDISYVIELYVKVAFIIKTRFPIDLRVCFIYSLLVYNKMIILNDIPTLKTFHSTDNRYTNNISSHVNFINILMKILLIRYIVTLNNFQDETLKLVFHFGMPYIRKTKRATYIFFSRNYEIKIIFYVALFVFLI